MSEPKWTPGPWEYGGGLVYSGRDIILDQLDSNMSNEDSHLLAAAPELYEALEAALPFTINNPGLHLNIKERLRKARGEDPRENV